MLSQSRQMTPCNSYCPWKVKNGVCFYSFQPLLVKTKKIKRNFPLMKWSLWYVLPKSSVSQTCLITLRVIAIERPKFKQVSYSGSWEPLVWCQMSNNFETKVRKELDIVPNRTEYPHSLFNLVHLGISMDTQFILDTIFMGKD